MAGWNIDFTVIAAIWMGGVILLVPLTGLCLRFGFVPLLAAIGDYRRSGRIVETEAEMQARIETLETRLEQLESMIDRSADDRHAVASLA